MWCREGGREGERIGIWNGERGSGKGDHVVLSPFFPTVLVCTWLSRRALAMTATSRVRARTLRKLANTLTATDVVGGEVVREG